MEICDQGQCTGCGVCADACPKNCITISYDQNGFLQSYVDEKKCINCKRCIAVCSANHPQNKNEIQSAYQVGRNDCQAILESTSGGVAALLTEAFIRNSGAVCGCGFDEKLMLRHTVETELSGVEKFKGSKYVQSNTTGVYRQVKDLLQDGTPVLFIGTPCQVSGLQSFLQKPYDQLLTVDLICHGVASSKVLQRYLDQHSDRAVRNVKFRSKTQGYIESPKNDLLLVCDDETVAIDHEKGIVFWFAAGISLRESCYSCPYVSTKRCGDLTLADFISEDMDERVQTYGASMVFINTPQGEKWFRTVADQACIVQQDLQESLTKYSRVSEKRDIPKIRQKFFQDLQTLSIDQMEKKYSPKKILPGKLVLYSRAAVGKIKRLLKKES